MALRPMNHSIPTQRAGNFYLPFAFWNPYFLSAPFADKYPMGFSLFKV
jgi:hypothetical protein